MRRTQNIFEDGFTVTVLLLASGAFGTWIADVSTEEAMNRGSSVLQGLWACIYLVVAIRAFPRRRYVLAVLEANKGLAVLITLALVSSVWSADAGLTLRRSIALLFSTLIGIDLAIRYPIDRILKLLRIMLALAVVLSVIVQVAFPSLVKPSEFGNTEVDFTAWSGIFPHKNTFGEILAMAALCVLVQDRPRLVDYLFAGVYLSALVLLIVAAKSTTPLVVLVVMIGICVAAQALRWPEAKLKTLGVSAGLLGVIIVTILLANLSSIASLFGRSSNLTGRTDIWSLSVASVINRWLLGSGYSAFWNVTRDSARIRALLAYDTPYAHNTLLDIALQLGLSGALAYVVMCFTAMRRALVYVRLHAGNPAMWPLAFLVFSLIHGISESDFSPNSLSWILFVTATCSVSPPLAVSEDDVILARLAQSAPPVLYGGKQCAYPSA